MTDTQDGGNRYLDYSAYEPKTSALDDELMTDPYELSDEALIADPFEVKAEALTPILVRDRDTGEWQTLTAAPKKPPKKKPAKTDAEKKAEEFAKKNKEIAGDITHVLDKVNQTLTSQVNPGASGGTTVFDLQDNVGTGEHQVPVTLITDHKGEVAIGREPAVCRTCGEPMEDHAQWNPTQNGPRVASVGEDIGWMDGDPIDNRPKRGDFEKDAHVPTYDLAPYDIQAAPVGTLCSACGHGGDARLGAVSAFPDPTDPVENKLYMHRPHFEEYKESMKKPMASQTVNTGDGKGVTINIYAKKDDE